MTYLYEEKEVTKVEKTCENFQCDRCGEIFSIKEPHYTVSISKEPYNKDDGSDFAVVCDGCGQLLLDESFISTEIF